MSRSLVREKVIGPDGKVRNPILANGARSGFVKKIDDELKKQKPNFKVVLDYYFHHFEPLVNSSNGSGVATYYSAFIRTLRNYFFPDNVTLWHLNGDTCVNHGRVGDHQKYRDFLCYIVRNAETFNALEYEKLTHLLLRIFEEEAMSRVTFIDYNQFILDIFKKYHVNEARDGKSDFCKGDNTSAVVARNGMAISNTKVNTMLENVKKGRFSPAEIEAADDVIQDIIGIADAARRIREETERRPNAAAAVAAATDDAGGIESARGMEDAEGGGKRRRAPIRRKSANRRTSRRRNKTRKYYKKF